MSSAAWPSKIVALTLTVKPRACAALIADTARSNTPFCDTALSWCSFRPSRCTEKNRYGDGSNRSSFFSKSSALVQSETNFLRATRPRTISPISLWIRGSPPGIATIGAPHSSAAADTGEVAAEQRLQHQHERIAFPAKQLLLDEITADTQFLEEGYCHCEVSFWTRIVVSGSARSQFGWKPEFDIFFPAGKHRHLDGSDTPQSLDHVVDQHFRRRGARRDADGFRILQPIRVQFPAIGNEITRDPDFGADFAQPV